MADKGHIIVPKPGQLLHELGGALAFSAVPDVKQQLADKMVVELLADIDAKIIGSATAAATGLNEGIFDALAGNAGLNKAAVDAINDFTRTKMKEDGFYKKLIPPLQISNDALDQHVGGITKATLADALEIMPLVGQAESTVFVNAETAKLLVEHAIYDGPSFEGPEAFGESKFIGKSFAVDDTTAYVKKESHLLEFFAYETVGATIGHVAGLLGADFGGGGDDEEEEDDGYGEAWKEAEVDVVFWYCVDTFLVYSIRRVSDNFFYDFASKRFAMIPASPRAGMPRAEPAKPSGFVYSTKLSGKLMDGEYVVTIRDSKADDVVVGVMALFMQGGKQTQTPPQGLEDTPIEEGIPTPDGTFRRAAARVRPVDTGGSA